MSNLERLTIGIVLLLCLASAFASDDAATQATDDKSSAESGSSEQGDEAKETEYREVMVVTASRTEQPLQEVPASMTVLTSRDLEQVPADDAGDYLRNVPGLNVSQMSARDVQVTSRAATNSLATSQLVLLDNRTLYLDFFGFVMWDFIPLDPREIKQIEVVRGPGSAVWGANAMNGVINMITKSPKEMQGTSVVLGGGELGTTYANVTHAGVAGKVGYKVAGSFYEQDPYDRPTGTIPGTVGPFNPNGTQYPDFQNQGTEQPKLNLRFDIDQGESAQWSVATGYAETDGIIHSGIGPFDIASGTGLSYAKVDWQRQAMRFTFFVNALDGDAINLLARDQQGQFLNFIFESQTYNLDFSNTTLLGERNVLTYGATARHNKFDLSIAPKGDTRDEFGAFVQDEIQLSNRVRWLIGARVDNIDPIGTVVSPRTSLLIGPRDHKFRFSLNRAFRAPSMVNNFLDTTIFSAATIPNPAHDPAVVDPGDPRFYQQFNIGFPTDATGNERLSEERLDAIEVGYVGSFDNGTTFTAAVYRNETKDSIDFFQSSAYSSANRPPCFPGILSGVRDGMVIPFPPDPPCPFTQLDPALLDGPLAGLLPRSFSYRNVGEIVDRGVELSLMLRPNDAWSVFVNYSWQDEPDVSGIEQAQLPNGTVRDAINTPPEHRANAGVAYSGPRFYANANVNFVDEAFWTDVLDERFWGPTDSFTTFNVGGGVNISDNVTLSVSAQNVTDERQQQHVFGDLISRKVTGQLILRFPK